MDQNVDLQIVGLYDVINDKISERLYKLASQVRNYKNQSNKSGSFIDKTFDKIDNAYDKSEQMHLTNARKILARLNNNVSSFGRENLELTSLIDSIKGLPVLDSEGLANQKIIEAFKKDYFAVKSDMKKKIEVSTSEVLNELNSVSSACNVYYGGTAERNTALKIANPQTIHENIKATVKKLSDLYNMKIGSYEYIQASTEQLTSSDLEVGIIEEYERMYHEHKVEVKAKRKMFFIKQEPTVVIANAKKAAVEKAHAMAVISRLNALEVPSSFQNTIAAINNIKNEYQKIYNNARKKLSDADFAKIDSQVVKVRQEEVKEELYQANLKRAVLLGYQLEAAKAAGNEKLVEDIASQIRILDISDRDLSYHVSQGQERYKTEKREKEYQTQILQEDHARKMEAEREANKELYNEAKRQLEAEGKFDPYYAQGGVDGINIVDYEEIQRLIRDRVEELSAQNRAINSSEKEEVNYRSMSPEQVTLEFLKATNAVPVNATIQEASYNPDFNIIVNSVRNGTDLTQEINAALARRTEKENRAYKLFKIDKSKYDALSETRRQQIVKYISVINELDDSKVQMTSQYRDLQSQIDYELQNTGDSVEVEGPRRHM